MKLILRQLIVAAVVFGALAIPAKAHETDQYTFPVDRQFADLGPFLTGYFYDAIDRGVGSLNSRIRDAMKSGGRKELGELHSPITVARAVNHEFPVALFQIEGFDSSLTAPEARLHYPGRIVDFKPKINIRRHVDIPLSPFNAWESGMIEAFGVYLGTDKIGHFTDMGMHYFAEYREALRKGKSEQAAMAVAIWQGTDNPITSEKGLLGWGTAGAYSNGDLMSNFMGFMFYRNLTEPVMLKGEVRSAMLERDGEFWKFSPRVRRDSDFFSLFISDHYNEALNPSVYLKHMRPAIRRSIEEEAVATLERYADRFGDRRGQEWFRQKQKELETYYGVNYGHLGGPSDLLLISEICYGKPPTTIDDRDSVGRTLLHLAAESGDVEGVRRLLDQGADINARIRSSERANGDWGSTPLHLAARDGRTAVVKLLLERGADANAVNDRMQTALHRASHSPEVAQLLIARGAKPDACDDAGRTPLQWAALDPEDVQSRTLQVMIATRAPLDAQDRDGRTALHNAAQAGKSDAVAALVKAGAGVNLKDRFGATPLHAAAALGDAQVVEVLLEARALVDARDDFGCTPLHDAARGGSADSVALLMRSGAQASVADEYGVTPLHLASRFAHADVARILLSRGANVYARSSSGSMPIDEANHAGSGAIARLLREAGTPNATAASARE